jgi:transposase
MAKASHRKRPPLPKSKSRRPKVPVRPATTPLINPLFHADAAGVDVGSGEFVAALPPGRCEQSVRTFSSFTSGVDALRDWFLAHGIRTVAMESTGNYWIMLYDRLTEAGMEVYLVNARHVKGVPGKKKTDVCDAQWLQQLHAAGLLRKSFRPALEIVPLRYLMRHRSDMVEHAAMQLHLMQKVLTEMNLKLHHVFSDIDGVSVQAIIEAILAGERDPQTLARLRDPRCKRPEADIMEALRGDYRPEYLFVLRQAHDTWKHLQEAIAGCDQELTRLAARVTGTVEAPLPPAPQKQHREGKNSPRINPFERGWFFYGVDLSGVPGICAGVIAALMSEVGTGAQLLEAFRSPEAFSSWLGLCPDNRVSGGKVLKARTRKVPSRLAKALRLAAFSLHRSPTEMGHLLRRLKGRLGKAEAITAVAHKLARIIYGMIRHQRPYDEKEAFKQTPQKLARRRQRLEKEAAALGLTLTEVRHAA